MVRRQTRFGSSMVRSTFFLLLVGMIPTISGWSIGNGKQRRALVPLNDQQSRRESLAALVSAATLLGTASLPAGADEGAATLAEIQVIPGSDSKQLFNEARALESQGNIAAAQRIYTKVTKISPNFIYGWSNLGNTQVALGQLPPAEESYSTAIDLCQENLKRNKDKLGAPRCNDLYVLMLNRGSLRLNNGSPEEALKDLQQADSLRGKPDAIVLQNLARAEELNGKYSASDRNYAVAISMTANEVSPFWLRAGLVKLQLGQTKDGFDLLKRVENRFPEAPEVRAAYATFLAAQGDQIAAQRKYLEIPDRQRQKYVDSNYLQNVVAWPPAARDMLAKVTSAVGDSSAN